MYIITCSNGLWDAVDVFLRRYEGDKKILAGALMTTLVMSAVACGSGGASVPAGSSSDKSAKTDYPTKAITMIVPYGAGGTTDLVGRQFAQALSKELGQSIIVENQAGASGSVGCQATLDADSDGYTVLFAAESLGTQRVMGISEMSYADFSPIALVANDPKVIVVAGNSKYNTIQDLLSDIKAKPGTIQMAYTGPGGSGHVQALIMNKFGYEPALTAYSSGSDGIVAVMGGQVEFTNSNYSTVKSYIESGDLKMLAVCSTERMKQYPDVSALSEVMEGADDYLSIPYTPLSLLVKNDVPEDVQEVLRSAAKKAEENEDFVKFMNDNNIDKLYETYTTVEDMNKFYSAWESKVSWILYDAGAATNSPEDYGIKKPE